MLWTIVEGHGEVLINNLRQKILIFSHGTKINYFTGQYKIKGRGFWKV